MSVKKQPLLLPEFNRETNEPLYNWRKRSNRHMQLFAETKYSGPLQMAIVEYIELETWGANPKRPWARITVAELEVAFSKTRQAISTAIDDAERRGIIQSKSFGKAKAGKCYRLTQLENVEKYVTPGPVEVESNPKPNLNQAQDIMPGRSSRPQQLRLQIPLGEAKYKVYNHLSHLIGYKLVPNSDGDGFDVHIIPKTSPETVEPDVSPLGNKFTVYSPIDEDGFGENKSVIDSGPENDWENSTELSTAEVADVGRSNLDESANGSEPASLPTNFHDELKRFRIRTDYRQFLTTLRLDVWGAATPDDVVDRAVKLADGMPVEDFERRLILRFGKNYRRALRDHKPGLLFSIITDAAVDHKARKEMPAPKGPPKPLAMMTEEELRVYVSCLHQDELGELVRQYPQLEPDIAAWRAER